MSASQVSHGDRVATQEGGLQALTAGLEVVVQQV